MGTKVSAYVLKYRDMGRAIEFPLWLLNALTYIYSTMRESGGDLTETEEDEAVWSHAMKREAERSKKQSIQSLQRESRLMTL